MRNSILPGGALVALAALLSTASCSCGHAATAPGSPSNASRGVGEWRVGPASDPDCHFQDIQDAIDATVANDGGFSTINIRVAGSHSLHAGNTHVVDGTRFDNITTVRIIGGHDSCSGTAQPGERTVLDAGGNGRIFLLSYEADDGAEIFTTELENFEIRNGRATFAGGGIRIRGHADRHRVRLRNLYVHDNETGNDGSGGGVSIEATAPGNSPTTWVSLSQDSVISGNYADGGGGGLACFNTAGNSNPPVLIFETPIVSNSASGNGGGLLVHGCRDVSVRTAGIEKRIGNNQVGVASSGGGVYVSGGGRVTLEASGTSAAAEVFGNLAAQGAGATVTGSSSRLELVNTRVSVNLANDEAGGLLVKNGGELVMGRLGGISGFPGDCRPLGDSDSRCSEIYANEAPAGAGLVVRGGGSAEINQTSLRGNRGQGAGASAAVVSGSGSQLQFEGTAVHDHAGSDFLMRAHDGALLRLRWSTIAGNDDAAGLAAVFQLANGPTGQVPTLNVDGSIVWEPSLILVSSASTDVSAAADCVIGHLDEEVSGFESAQFYSHVDPRLRDRYNADLRPALNSPAIDYCDDAIAAAFDDFFNRPRGQDYNLDPDLPPVDSVPGGTFDLGAFEQPPTEDVLHADRFEVEGAK